jgi:hypothetical protein
MKKFSKRVQDEGHSQDTASNFSVTTLSLFLIDYVVVTTKVSVLVERLLYKSAVYSRT